MSKTKTVGTAKSRSKLDLAEVVSRQVELKEVFITRIFARRCAHFEDRAHTVALHVNVDSKANRHEGLIHVNPQFLLTASLDEASEADLVRIEAEYCLQYRLSSFADVRKQHIDAFGRLNGLYNAWPYWREFVQSATVRMGLPPLTIPVLPPVGAKRRPQTKAVGKAKSGRR